jgi:hypothetical protein
VYEGTALRKFADVGVADRCTLNVGAQIRTFRTAG